MANNPAASIIIPVFGNLQLTLDCLRSIRETACRASYEVIVIDDASTDNTRQVLSEMPNLTLICNDQNTGFVRSCNKAAASARGEYIIFLNNDTQVTAGWLDELLQTFQEDPSAGLVGAKLVYPDGRLQEAGCIVWQNGTAWNYGNGENPQEPRYNYRREVDYCSGACLAVPRLLFNEMGGFDEHYAPAYAEDADLAFRIRRSGRKILYQPLAAVFHREGATAGRDTRSGVKHFQEINQLKFFDRWRSELSSHRPNGQNPEEEKDRGAKKRLLIIDEITPTPDQDSGSTSMLYNILIFQQLGYQITFIPANLSRTERYTADLQRIGVECLYRPFVPSVETHLKKWGERYQAVLISRVTAAERFMDMVRLYCPQAFLVFNTVDLHFLRQTRQSQLHKSAVHLEAALELEKKELGLVARADCALVVSSEEKKILQSKLPGHKNIFHIYPASGMKRDHTPFEKRRGMAFFGGFNHVPNVDAMTYFVRDIFPLIQNRLPGVPLYIVGSHPPPDVQSLASENIVVTGYTPDLDSFLGQCRLSIAPIRYGAGVKMKVVTSLSAGLPAVLTSAASEGMGLEDGKDILTADTPKEFADAVVRLHTDKALWERLSENGYNKVRSLYSLDAVKSNFRRVCSYAFQGSAGPVKPVRQENFKHILQSHLFDKAEHIAFSQRVSELYQNALAWDQLSGRSLTLTNNVPSSIADPHPVFTSLFETPLSTPPATKPSRSANSNSVSAVLLMEKQAEAPLAAIQSVLLQKSASPPHLLIAGFEPLAKSLVETASRHPDQITLVAVNPSRGEKWQQLYREVLTRCKSDFIAFIGPDQVWAPEHLAFKLKIFTEYPDVVCIHNPIRFVGEGSLARLAAQYCEWQIFFGGGLPIPARDVFYGFDDGDFLATHSSLMLRRQAVSAFDSSLQTGHQFREELLNTLKKTGKFYYAGQALTEWRIPPDIQNAWKEHPQDPGDQDNASVDLRYLHVLAASLQQQRLKIEAEREVSAKAEKNLRAQLNESQRQTAAAQLALNQAHEKADRALIEFHALSNLRRLEQEKTKALEQANEQLRRDLTEVRTRLTQESLRAQTAESSLASLQLGYFSVIGTLSWKITRPLRLLKAGIQSARKIYSRKARDFRIGTMGIPQLKPNTGSSQFTQPFLALPNSLPSTTGRSFLINLDSYPELQTCSQKIAVHLHLYYPDLLPEFKGFLKNLPFRFTLLVSVPNPSTKQACMEELASLKMIDSIDVRVVPNRGRDIASFCTVFAPIIRQFDIVAHIHTKKSLYNNNATAEWRPYLLKNLLGSEKRIRQILHLFEKNSKVGLVYPETFSRVPYYAHTWLANRSLGREWCRRLGIAGPVDGYFDFPAGLMFFARVDAIEPLLTSKIRLSDFDEEAGQIDGTLAHTLERLFGLAPPSRGYTLAIIKDNQRMPDASWNITQYLNRSLPGLLKQIQNPHIKTVILDVFDTLLIRPTLHPETSKKIVLSRIEKRLQEIYLRWRIPAESAAREKAGRDVGLEVIYESLKQLSGISSEDADSLRRLEETVEQDLVRPRAAIVELIRWAKIHQKRLIIASDTFLSKDRVENMLRSAGFADWDRLYVSSEEGIRKDSGELYSRILADEKRGPNEILVIGDNERSDVQLPLFLGFPVLHIMKAVDLASANPRWAPLLQKIRSNGNLDDEFTLGIALNKSFDGIDFSNRPSLSLAGTDPKTVGFSALGPLISAFAAWLIQQSKTHSVKHLYFLSREGLILKQVYDRWAALHPEAPPSQYLAVSRRSATVACLSESSDLEKLAQTRYFPNTIESFFYERYGLENGEVDWQGLSRFGITGPHDTIEIKKECPAYLSQALSFLRPAILARAKKERQALQSYLSKSGLTGNPLSSAVVDIGYSGTIQNHLMDLCSRKLHGFYLMTSHRAGQLSKTHGVQALGAAFSQRTSEIPCSILYEKSFELERLLNSGESQVLHYFLAGDEPLPACRPFSDAEKKGIPIRSAIHLGILEYADQASAIRSRIHPGFTPSLPVGIALAESFLTNQTAFEKQLMDRIPLDDHYCGRGFVSVSQPFTNSRAPVENFAASSLTA